MIRYNLQYFGGRGASSGAGGTYKGMNIEKFGNGYTVLYQGDELYAESLKEAKSIIDSIKGSEKIEKINDVKKQLKGARANEERKRRAYQAASGAVTGFDKETKKTNPARYEKAVADRDKAKKAYNDAVKKTDKLETQLNKLSKQKKLKNAPLF